MQLLASNLIQRNTKLVKVHTLQKDKRLFMPTETVKGVKHWAKIDSKLLELRGSGLDRLETGEHLCSGREKEGTPSKRKPIPRLLAQHSTTHSWHLEPKLRTLLHGPRGD